MKKRKILYLVTFFVFLAFILVVEKNLYLRALGSFLVVKDEVQHADAIVVLAGEDERVDQAVELYKGGFSRFIIMSGGKENSSITFAEEMKQDAVKAGVPAERILLEPKADHTYQHPLFIKPILVSHDFKSVIVVSSPYNMRRVKMLFDRVFYNTGIKLIYYPVVKSWFNVQYWWQSKEGRKAVFLEYTKMAVNFWGTGVDDLICDVIKKFKKE